MTHIFTYLSLADVIHFGLTSQHAALQALLHCNHMSRCARRALRDGDQCLLGAIQILHIILKKDLQYLHLITTSNQDALTHAIQTFDSPIPSLLLPWLEDDLLKEVQNRQSLALELSIPQLFQLIFTVQNLLEKFLQHMLDTCNSWRIPMDWSLRDVLYQYFIPWWNARGQMLAWGIHEQSLSSSPANMRQSLLQLDIHPSTPQSPHAHRFERLCKLIGYNLHYTLLHLFCRQYRINLSMLNSFSSERILKHALTAPSTMSLLLQYGLNLSENDYQGTHHTARYACLTQCYLTASPDVERACTILLTHPRSTSAPSSRTISNVFLAAIINNQSAMRSLLTMSTPITSLNLPHLQHLQSIRCSEQTYSCVLYEQVLHLYLSRFLRLFPLTVPVNAQGRIAYETLLGMQCLSFQRLCVLNLDIESIQILHQRGLLSLKETPSSLPFSCSLLTELCAPLAPFRAEATQNSIVSMMQLLISLGANVNATTTPNRMTPLMLCCASSSVTCRLEVAQCLLDHGANPRDIDYQGFTALHYLAYYPTNQEQHTLLEDQASLIRLLIARGAPIQAQDNRGRTASTIAHERGNQLFLQILDAIINGSAC